MTESTGAGTRPAAAASGPGDRLADDLAAVVHQELDRVRGDFAETARRAGTGGLLLTAAGGCCLLAVGAGSTAALRVLETFLPRRLAPFGLTAGYLLAAAALGAAGLRRLRAAGGSSERLAEETRRAVSAAFGH